MERITANVPIKCVCVCLVTLGVNAATTVGIKWHHVGRNTECFLMRDTPLNSARVLLPASHFIRTNYLKSRLQLCFTLLSEDRVAPLLGFVYFNSKVRKCFKKFNVNCGSLM